MTRVDELKARLVDPMPTDRLWGWLGPGLIALLGGFVRFWNLGQPHALVFDETYYVKEAWSLLKYGVEMQTRPEIKDPNALWVAGNPDIFSATDGTMVVHLSVGKWIIAGGEWLFGMQSAVGWRFSVAVVGTLSILILGRVARRLFRSTALGCIAAFLLAFEGLHLVMSRTGILDIMVSFFILLAFGALLIDRDRSRSRLAERVGALYGVPNVYTDFRQLLARDDIQALYAVERVCAALTDPPGQVVMDAAAWDAALGDYWADHAEVGLDADARGPAYLSIQAHPDGGRRWAVR